MGAHLAVAKMPRTYPTGPTRVVLTLPKTLRLFILPPWPSYCAPLLFPLHSIAGAGDGSRRRDFDGSWAAAARTGVGGLLGVLFRPGVCLAPSGYLPAVLPPLPDLLVVRAFRAVSVKLDGDDHSGDTGALLEESIPCSLYRFPIWEALQLSVMTLHENAE
jgi:hypothetical protein